MKKRRNQRRSKKRMKKSLQSQSRWLLRLVVKRIVQLIGCPLKTPIIRNLIYLKNRHQRRNSQKKTR